MVTSRWLSDNYIEVFGAITGIIYVFLEIRQNLWLWPVGIITSAVYIWVFFTSKFYADMSLQVYYLGISCLGWYWWARGTGRIVSSETSAKEEGTEHRAQGAGQGAQGTGRRAQGSGQEDEGEKGRKGEREEGGLHVTRLNLRTGIVLIVVFLLLYTLMYIILSRLTDSPVPGWDSFITSLSIVATWMLARKIYEHWFVWIVVNFVSAILFLTRGLYPTVFLYIVYGLMSFSGLVVWKKTILLPRSLLPGEKGSKKKINFHSSLQSD
jgi:nicotinamide mononucleotide transporter